MTSALESDSLEAAAEKADESELPLTNGFQTDVPARPVPKPRSKIKSTNNKINTEESGGAESSVEVNKITPPARPPLPSTIYVPSSRPAADTDGNSELSEKPQRGSAEGRPSPLSSRPERPPLPSIYYDRYCSLRKETKDAEDVQREDDPSSLQQQDSVCNATEDTGQDSDIPEVPPRLPLQSLYPCSEYDPSLSQNRPPPPSFTPPSPPSEVAESIYSELEFPPYLTVLPEDEQNIVPSRTVSQTESNGRGAPRRQHTSKESEEIFVMLRWLKKASKLDYMAPSVYGLSIEEEIRTFNLRANNVKQALRLFNLLMIKRNEVLRDYISQFSDTATDLDKGQKKSKTLNVAGGTTGAVGGVTAVIGIAFAPVTFGASLIATAVGAGMVAAAGGMGAHAVNTTKNVVCRATVENLVEDYKAHVVDMDLCLEFILAGMNELQRHDLPRLQRAGAKNDALRIAQLSQSVFKNNMKIGGRTSSERLLQAFAKELHSYFKDKDPEKLRKSKKTKFSGRVHLLAQNLQDELDYLNQMWEKFC